MLFANFFLIILAYYQVKAASRSMVLDYFDPGAFPWLWIATAAVLVAFIGIYHRLVAQIRRERLVLGSLGLFIALLVVFRVWFHQHGPSAAIGFYILVDIFSVVLVEQFWSLTNAVSSREEGRRSYWFVGSGGLAGGVAGGAVAALLVDYTPMTTPDLLLSCAAFLTVIVLLNVAMVGIGLYRELERPHSSDLVADGGLRALFSSRYLVLIALALLCAQLAQPVVEYQFLSTVNDHYPQREARTVFISWFFSVLGLVSVAVNVLMTPFIHHFFGIMAGLATQPIALLAFSLGYMGQPTLWMAASMKIADRGLSYSINRASKEQLYIPVDPVHAYRAKAWIDMLGYRLFKVLGSALILGVVGSVGVTGLSWLTIMICMFWIGVLALIAREQARIKFSPLPVSA